MRGNRYREQQLISNNRWRIFDRVTESWYYGDHPLTRFLGADEFATRRECRVVLKKLNDAEKAK